MKAMILAAGEGRRMLPLTANCPKPLLPLGNTTLIGYHIERLRQAGIVDIVINHAYLGHQIERHLGDGSQLGVQIQYSAEPYPLETGGGINRALPLLGEDPFLLVNGDVFTDFPFAEVDTHCRDVNPSTQNAATHLKPLYLLDTHIGLHSSENDFIDTHSLGCLGHLILVPNPPQHPFGDFGLTTEGAVQPKAAADNFTYSGISVLHPRLLSDFPNRREKFPLVEVFHWAISHGCLKGSLYDGVWQDVGTPERYHYCQQLFTKNLSG